MKITRTREIAVAIIIAVVPITALYIPYWLRRLGVDIAEASWLGEVFPIAFLIFWACICVLWFTRKIKGEDSETAKAIKDLGIKIDRLIEINGRQSIIRDCSIKRRSRR